jgi:hypothetical protein
MALFCIISVSEINEARLLRPSCSRWSHYFCTFIPGNIREQSDIRREENYLTLGGFWDHQWLCLVLAQFPRDIWS